jgi:hypothetical protein
MVLIAETATLEPYRCLICRFIVSKCFKDNCESENHRFCMECILVRLESTNTCPVNNKVYSVYPREISIQILWLLTSTLLVCITVSDREGQRFT